MRPSMGRMRTGFPNGSGVGMGKVRIESPQLQLPLHVMSSSRANNQRLMRGKRDAAC